MRRMSVVVTVVLALAAGTVGGAAPPAAADSGEFFAAVPGTVLTPYWLDAVSCIGCNPDSLVRTTLRDAAGYDQPLFNGRDYIEVCANPTPPGATHAVDIGFPGGAGVTVRIAPAIDWDVAVCAQRGPNGEELRADPNDGAVRWREEAFGADVIGETCSNPFGVPELQVGCRDEATAATVAAPYRLIGYNWSDVPNCAYEWSWI